MARVHPPRSMVEASFLVDVLAEVKYRESAIYSRTTTILLIHIFLIFHTRALLGHFGGSTWHVPIGPCGSL
jgi:hypothetical protein